MLVVGRHLAMEDHLNEVKIAARSIVDGLVTPPGHDVAFSECVVVTPTPSASRPGVLYLPVALSGACLPGTVQGA